MTDKAFSGVVEFSIAFSLIGRKVNRSMRAIYRFTPAWPYYSAAAGKLVSSDSILDIALEVLAKPSSDRRRSGVPGPKAPYWSPMGDLLRLGVLNTPIYDAIRNAVDYDARQQDRLARAAAGLPVPPLPESI